MAVAAERCPAAIQAALAKNYGTKIFEGMKDATPSTWYMVGKVFKHVDGAMDHVDVEKTIIPSLVEYIRGGCSGNVSGSMPHIFLLLSSLPKDILRSL